MDDQLKRIFRYPCLEGRFGAGKEPPRKDSPARMLGERDETLFGEGEGEPRSGPCHGHACDVQGGAGSTPQLLHLHQALPFLKVGVGVGAKPLQPYLEASSTGGLILHKQG